mmetsp:Transcript_3143/g.6959  ORF Transcript_3143/g.6959 Transcript_3143/m.6959 type:complete len:392 (+) Transcript_3143:1999-3174(+)
MINMSFIISVGQNSPDLTKLRCRHITIVIQPGRVSPEVIVAVVPSPAGIKVDFHFGEMNGHVLSVEHHFPIFSHIHLGTVTSCREGHLIHATAHGTAGDVLDVSTLVHVVIHAHIKQIVRLVAADGAVLVIGPRKTVAVDGSLAVVIIAGELREALGGIVAGGLLALGEVGEDEVGVVGGILIHAVLVIRPGAIPVVVSRLAILRPAAHGSMGRAVVEVGEGVFPLAGPGDAAVLCGVSVKFIDFTGVLPEDGGRDLIPVGVLGFVKGFDLLLPFAAAVVEQLLEVKVGALVGGVGERNYGGIVVQGLAQHGPRVHAGLRASECGKQLGVEIFLRRELVLRAGGTHDVEHLRSVFFQEHIVGAVAGNVSEGEWPADATALLGAGFGSEVQT